MEKDRLSRPETWRERKVKELGFAIYKSICASSPSVCLYTSAPEVIDGEIVGLEDVGLDGNFDFIKIADSLFGRIS